MAKIDGARVRRLREEKGLTQLYVATVVGVTTDTVSRWENRRYQTIKRQNAVKLAEALEVSLEEILDKEPEEPTPETSTEDSEEVQSPPPTTAGLPRRQVFAAMLAVLIGMAILVAVRLVPPASQVTAHRFLPAHSAPGSPFPVKIVVTGNTEKPVSVILKEDLPPGIRVLASIPPAKDTGTRELRWLRKTTLPAEFLYFCTIDPSVPMEGLLHFTGSITQKGRRTSPVAATSAGIQVLPHHWADTNRDGTIDDEEILAVFDDFGDLEGKRPTTLDFDRIEDIWAAGAYRWDPATSRFILPE